jgi:D-amino-acid dehydrogenase
MHLVVIGNGIIGTCIGAWLQRDGHAVTFVDPLEAGEATSFGNAGSLTSSPSLPLGQPNTWKSVPRYLLDPLGPLAIRPSYLPRILPWLLRFLRHSTEAEVIRIAKATGALQAPVFEAYEPLLQRAGGTSLMDRRGCLFVYSSEAARERDRWALDLRRRLGAELREVGADEVASLEPALAGRFPCGILAPANGQIFDPSALTKAIFARAVEDGATSRRTRAKGVRTVGDRVTGVTLEDGGEIGCDGVVVASGAWSGAIAEALGVDVPLETERGYHVTIRSNPPSLTRVVSVPERSVFVSPMRMGLRIAGTVEFAGLAAPPNWKRADALVTIGRELFPNLDTSDTSRWMGHRPSLPDSLPVIGPAPKLANAWLAFGHGHLGMCLGATTGREIANLVAGRPTEVDLTPFAATRFH